MADVVIDVVTDGGTVNPGGGLSWSHVCAASAVLLVDVGTYAQPTTPTVTYNGVSLSLVNNTATFGDSNDRHYVFALAAPASGSNLVVVTLASSAQVWAHSISFVNAKTTQTFGNSTTHNPAAGPSVSTTFSTLVDRSLVFIAANGYHGAPAASLNVTARLISGTMLTGDSGSVITPAQSTVFTTTDASAEADTHILVEIEPAATAARRFFLIPN